MHRGRRTPRLFVVVSSVRILTLVVAHQGCGGIRLVTGVLDFARVQRLLAHISSRLLRLLTLLRLTFKKVHYFLRRRVSPRANIRQILHSSLGEVETPKGCVNAPRSDRNTHIRDANSSVSTTAVYLIPLFRWHRRCWYRKPSPPIWTDSAINTSSPGTNIQHD